MDKNEIFANPVSVLGRRIRGARDGRDSRARCHIGVGPRRSNYRKGEKMGTLFDDISRSLASPMPRRKVFGHIARGVLGAVALSTLGVNPAWAACPQGQFVCKGKLSACCINGATCCPNPPNTNAHCCTPPNICCGAACCKSGYKCSSTGKCVKSISS